MVGEAGLEPTTPGLEGRCSIQLSYSPANMRSALKLIPGFRRREHEQIPRFYQVEVLPHERDASHHGVASALPQVATIGAADAFGLPVSTTHVLSSGVAGTMAANHTGLQWSTVRNLAMAWVLTLPVSMVLSGFLFWAFRMGFK